MDIDEFSDDEFEGITDTTLQELENQAILSTQANLGRRQQHPPQQPKQHRHAGHGWADDEDLDTTEVIHDAGVAVGRPVVDKTLRSSTQQPSPQQQPQQQQQQQQHQGAPAPPPPPCHAPPPAVAAAAAPSRPRPPLPNPQWNPAINVPASTASSLVARTRLHVAGSAASQSSQLALAPPGPSQSQSEGALSALQRRIRALEAELHTARGEASILRSNSTKAQQEYDAQVSYLKKLNAEQATKYEQAVQAALAAEKSASTELQFIQRDMKEVSDRARRREPAAAGAAGSTTPRKAARNWGMADGFDDVDIAASPSRGQGRGKNQAGSVAVHIGERTPSKGKRKRPLVDSPVAALETHIGDIDMIDAAEAVSEPVPQRLIAAASAAPFDFLQLVLGHGIARDQPPTFDALSRYSYPSDPTGMSISTMIFERLPLLGNPDMPMQLLADFALQMISLWTRCYEEQLWAPIKFLVSLVDFTFQLNTSFVVPQVFRELIPIAQASVFLVAEGPQRLQDGTVTNADEYSILEQHIDSSQILSLLYTTAQGCATTPAETEDGVRHHAASMFWGLFSFETVRLLLAPKQRFADIVATLELLGTSSLPDSIGPLVDGREAAATASDVIDRVSAKLTEHSRAPNTTKQKRRIRDAALRALIAFARHAFGARQLASHRDALPRLVVCLSTSIDDLYDQPLSLSAFPPLPRSLRSPPLKIPESTAFPELCRIISQCVLLIHALVTDPLTADLADISGKLAVYHGGHQRYLIALGRLTFAEEDLVLEAGIEGEIVEAAHELLEMAVTPERGEFVSEAFGA